VTDLVPREQLSQAHPTSEIERTALLAEIRGSVLRLLAELPKLPERIRISAQDIAVELQWRVTDQHAPPQGSATTTPIIAATPTTEQPASGAASPAPAGDHRITAATVGAFYRRSEPGAPPFVEVGDSVQVGQQIAIVEAMKLMIPVEADVDGLVCEVLKDDGQPVEFGEPLFLIKRS
jgi:acetyl-CoA carboxylase biotin carboxyl carrier protein